jgi:hypothetical protein
MSIKPAEILRVDGREVNITRPEKVLFPEDGITKGDLIRYYQRISPWMLPHLEGRPLALQRFPDGIDKASFFQKAAAPYYPAWIKKATVPKAGGTRQARHLRRRGDTRLSGESSLHHASYLAQSCGQKAVSGSDDLRSRSVDR